MIDRMDAERSVARIGMFTGRGGRTLVDLFISEHPHFLEMRGRRRQLSYGSGPALWFVWTSPTWSACSLRARISIPDTSVSGLTQMVPTGDRRLALLDELERRFGPD